MTAATRRVRSGFTATGTAIVNWAPPSVAVLGPDAPALDGQQSADNPQPHAGTRDSRLRRAPAIEPFEDVRQVLRCESRAVVADLERQLVV